MLDVNLDFAWTTAIDLPKSSSWLGGLLPTTYDDCNSLHCFLLFVELRVFSQVDMPKRCGGAWVIAVYHSSSIVCSITQSIVHC